MAAESLAIPERRNTLILLVAMAVSAALLYGASHAESWPVVLACAVAFSFTANTLFSLLHEAVHGVFSQHKRWNAWAGRLAAAWFPTAFSIQRAFHLTHHRNNRSKLEQFDVVHEGDRVWLKHAQWYAILTGLYWVVAVVGVFAYLVVPRVLRAGSLRDRDSKVAEQTSSRAYLAALDELDPVGARLEILFAIALQVALFFALDLSWQGWLACYAAFGLNWSSLQYADHAFSPLDPRDGAWNLRVGPLSRALFLNYHLHLAHHQHPRVSWIHLPKLVDPDVPQPTFWRVWLAMWRGPRREGAPPLDLVAPGFFGLPARADAPLVWGMTVGFALFFTVVYGAASAISGEVPWRIAVDLPGESAIPFVPAAALVYLSMDLLVGLSPFVLRRWREMAPVFAALCAQTLIGAVFFVLLPVETAFGERHVEGLVGAVFAVADTLNMERNFLPSLHVSFAFTAAIALAPKAGRVVRGLLFVWAGAIALSTMLIHEHHVVDVLAGVGLAVFTMRVVGGWVARPVVLDAIDVELLCLRDLWAFGRRHPRYWLIALGLFQASFPRWRKRRVLRTGFCLLQQLDDLLDGDRACAREPLDVVGEVAAAIETGRFDKSDRMRFARAFTADLREVGGEPAIEDALRLIRVMQRDRRRVLEGAPLERAELREHLRETFELSVDLMLVAGGAEVRSSDAPELIDAFCWCSVMRDLEEDLDAGLINVPRDVLEDAGLRPPINYSAVVEAPEVRRWMDDERARAVAALDATDGRLVSLSDRRGVSILRMFARSIRGFARRRLLARYPFLAAGERPPWDDEMLGGALTRSPSSPGAVSAE